jgi:phosphate/sulfate permease
VGHLRGPPGRRALGKRGGRQPLRAQIRWGVTGQIFLAWVLTLPAAAGCAAAGRSLIDAFGSGGTAGAIVATALAAALCVVLYLLSRRRPVTAATVNDEQLFAPRARKPRLSGARAA